VLLVCAEVITLLVIIYQGYSPSLVCARIEEELEAVFACSLWLTGLTGGGKWSDRCHLLSRARDRSDWWRLAVLVFEDEILKLVVSPIHSPLGDIKILSRNHCRH
jgi:hypothetical protein